MKAVSKSGNQKANTSRKADGKLTLNLTTEQAARIELLAKLLQTTPEELAIATLFSCFDMDHGNWEEFSETIDNGLYFYTENPREASDNELGNRTEDLAPSRIKRAAGYVSPLVAGAKEVARV
jgi:hypothetical protein